ncbi:unnamed protein product [Amoebophrya sp. A120]|nr:unnamed protein product [Amoebophrya sp. A120]|eukprot:GSA120T00014345001.1
MACVAISPTCCSTRRGPERRVSSSFPFLLLINFFHHFLLKPSNAQQQAQPPPLAPSSIQPQIEVPTPTGDGQVDAVAVREEAESYAQINQQSVSAAAAAKRSIVNRNSKPEPGTTPSFSNLQQQVGIEQNKAKLLHQQQVHLHKEGNTKEESLGTGAVMHPRQDGNGSKFENRNQKPSTFYDESVITSIADLHGDFKSAVEALKLAKIMDDQWNWVAGNKIFIQTGDIVDRGNNGREIYDLMFRLQDQAEKAGGRVIMLLGNHEAIRMQNDVRYRGPKETSWSLHPKTNDDDARGIKAWAEGGWLRTALEKRSSTMAIAGRSLYVHAALTLSYAKKLETIAQEFDSNANLDTPMSPELREKVFNKFHEKVVEALRSQDFLNFYINDYSPFWSREYDLECAEAERVFKFLNVDRIIAGHTPQTDGRIGVGCDGKIVLADTAMSIAYRQSFPKGQVSVLTIADSVPEDGKETVVQALYKDQVMELEKQAGHWGSWASVVDPNMVKQMQERDRKMKNVRGGSSSSSNSGSAGTGTASSTSNGAETTPTNAAATSSNNEAENAAKTTSTGEASSSSSSSAAKASAGATSETNKEREDSKNTGATGHQLSGTASSETNLASKLLSSTSTTQTLYHYLFASPSSTICTLVSLLIITLVFFLFFRFYQRSRMMGGTIAGGSGGLLPGCNAGTFGGPVGVIGSMYYMWKSRTPRLVV